MTANVNVAGLISRNRKLARKLWSNFVDSVQLRALTDMTRIFRFSVAMGDLLLLRGSWYVTHTGLIRLSRRQRCVGIGVEAISEFCDAKSSRWTFKAIVYKSQNSKGFTGYGDADPSNVSPLVHGAEMRVAETRAVNRALRKAYGIGICSVEEIGSFAGPVAAKQESKNENRKPSARSVNAKGSNGSNNGNGTRVRDRLCQIIRHHQLDPVLVKSYAVDFCGTKTLRDASREQVENFVVHLADWAEKDRNALLCQLNSYARTQQGAA